MTQDKPYPFRESETCECHAKCSDRWPPGQFLWCRAKFATGVFDFLRDGVRCSVVPDTFMVCQWRHDGQYPFPPDVGREAVVSLLYGVPDGSGVPHLWVFRVDVEAVGPGFAGDFAAEWSGIVTEQGSCRTTPDETLIVLADPPNPFWPPGSDVGELRTLWGGTRNPFLA